MTKEVILKGQGYITKCETSPDQKPHARFLGDRGCSSVTIQWCGPHMDYLLLHRYVNVRGEFELSVTRQEQKGTTVDRICKNCEFELDSDGRCDKFACANFEEKERGPFKAYEYIAGNLSTAFWTITFQDLPFARTSYAAYEVAPFKKAQAFALVEWLNERWAERKEDV